MSDVLMVVPSKGLLAVESGTVGFKFLFDAKVDPDYYDRPYGFIARINEGRHAGAWRVVVGTNERAQLNSRSGGEMLNNALRSLPDCVVVVSLCDQKAACTKLKELGHNVTIHEYQGAIDISA